MTTATLSTCPRCGARLPAGRFSICPRCLVDAELPPPLLGESVELIEEIGRGGMGSVWKARHQRLGRFVAVKFPTEELARDPDFAARFAREAQTLARLNHPGIVAVHDFGIEDGHPFIVMEYVEGRPLSEMLPLSAERGREVALQILEALAYAHERGVVHRDIKPANVLVEHGGRAKLSDFGIARIVTPGPSVSALTTAGRVIGTPAYMAPEALAGAPPDPRMDVFSVGVLLQDMMKPLPDPLAAIASRATARDAQERYAGAAPMHAAVLAASVGAPADALPAEERHWLRAVALVQTLATAAVLWALLLSVTPRVLRPGDVQPLIMLATEALPDGRLLSRARFETWPTLAAVALLTLALVAQGLLRRHWREADLARVEPGRAVPASTAVLVCGAVAVSLYAFRHLVGTPAALWTSYVPILGGLLELAIVFLAWTAVLEAWRTSRPLLRETRLWLGAILALVPPTFDLARYLRDWTP